MSSSSSREGEEVTHTLIETSPVREGEGKGDLESPGSSSSRGGRPISLTLVATSLSSVFTSTQVATHVVPTTRRDIPLPNVQTTLISGHATHSSLFHSPKTGQVLIRLIEGDLAIELVSLSTNVSPIRFIFPAPVVPSPTLVYSESRNELHLLAITDVGSLYRLVLPIYEGGNFWHDPFERDWCREWQIKRLATSEPKLVHVLNENIVAVSLNTGGYVRLESDGASTHEQWSEVEYKLSNWYSSLLPVLPGMSPQPGEIISFASNSLPKGVNDVFSLSRDRVLRRWTVAKGCRTELSLSTGGLSSGNGDKPATLLDPCPQSLLQAFSEDVRTEFGNQIVKQTFLLVFLPTLSSTTPGGHFQFIRVDDHRLEVIKDFSSSAASTQCKMQDFIYDSGNLYVLWEKQGESFLEATKVDQYSEDCVWMPAFYGRPSQDTDKTVETLLLSAGSLSDKFLSTILCPGAFSALTLREALHGYREHYLSLPGPHQHALLEPHATLSEDIAAAVGCSVRLAHDPQTGVALHEQYSNALRRDWEGFLARCKEIERSARWPVALGIGEEKGQVLILERERIGQCVEEDMIMQLYRTITQVPEERDGVRSLIATCWTLRKSLPVHLSKKIEAETMNILASEISFPITDIIIASANRIFSREEVDSNLDAWVQTQIASFERSVDTLDETLRNAVRALATLDKAVKQEEEDDDELEITHETTEWSRALITSYVNDSIEMRYELNMALATLLFVMGEDLRSFDPIVLLETFAIFRGTAMIQLIAKRPAGDLNGSRPSIQEPDDVVSRMHSLQMSQGGKNPTPTYSLVHLLVSRSGLPSLVPAAAHTFMLRLGLLFLVSQSSVTKAEISICERLRLLGYREIARHLLSWLPRTPAVCYVTARLLIDAEQGDDAVVLLQGVAGCFGSDSVLSIENRDALSAVLPKDSLFPSEYAYYIHVAEIFRNAGLLYEEIVFTKLALSVLPEDQECLDSWNCVTKGYIDLGLYDLAYSSLLASPYQETRQHYVSSLVYKMCEEDAADQLFSMNFRDLEQEVEASLSFKARNADPRSVPNYANILYMWYANRGDFRNAALVMYLRARKLSDLSNIPISPDESEQLAEALVVSINALKLLDQKNAWILVPSSVANQPRKKRRLDSYIPEDRFTAGTRDVEIVTISDIEQEYVLLNATLELLRRDPTALRMGDGLPSPWVLVSKLTHGCQYDLAMQTAKALGAEMTEIFQRLSVQCLRLSAAPESAMMEMTSVDWLLTDKVSSWSGEPADRGWRYLRQCLGQYDSVETDFKYSKEVLDTLLAHDRSSLPPPWLLQNIEEHHPDYLIRCFLKYGVLDEALSRTLQLVRKTTANWNRLSNGTQTARTWLPYSLVDTVLKSTEECTSSDLLSIRSLLESELKQRIARAKKQSEKAP